MADEINQARARSSAVSGYAWYVLGVLVVVYALNFIDRQIISILAEDIKTDLGVRDAEIGFLYGTAFAVFYALFGIPLGRLADSWYRGRLIGLGLLLWSSMTALSGFANSFGTLAAARIGVGIGEASASPAAYSLLSDYFPKEKRATAVSIYSSGLYIGGGLSLPIGGYVLSRWNTAYPDATVAPLGLTGWQAAFLAVGLPGLLLALWVFTLREPARGASEGLAAPAAKPGAWRDFGRELATILPPFTLIDAARRPRGLQRNLWVLMSVGIMMAGMMFVTGDIPQWLAYGIGLYAILSWIESLKYRDRPVWRLIWGTRETILMTFAFGGISFVNYAFSFWTPPYALRAFYPGGPAGPGLFLGGTAAEEVATLVGWGAAVSCAIGVIGGGIIADRLRARDPRGRLFVCMAAIILPIPILIWMFTTRSAATFFWLVPVANVFTSLWVGAAVATLQDAVLPRMRATAGATYILGTTMVGLALGPYYVGKVADLSGSLATGIYALFAMAPFTLGALWYVSRRIAHVEATRYERAKAAGEAI